MSTEKEISALDQTIIDAINSSGALIKDGIEGTVKVTKNLADVVSTQVPDIVEQLLLWKLSEAIFYFVICLVLFVLAVRYLMSLKNKQISEDSSHIPLGILSITSSPFSFLGAIHYASDILYISIAPKVWLLEYITNLTKSIVL